MNYKIKDIHQLKHQIKQLIDNNSNREVTPHTKYKTSGIYMIYIDNFTNDVVVPIYIGQSRDIQKRYKQHFTEILALNRLSYEEYKKYFFSEGSSFYEGRFKTCKIFKYMLENNCTLQDFRMIILDEIEVEKLEDREQEYFRRLLPSFFGFNQFNSFLMSLPFRFSNTQMNEEEIKDYFDLIIEDIKGIHVYYNNGFTKFNLEHSMPTPRYIDYLLQDKEQWSQGTLFKFEKVKSDLYNLYKQYIFEYFDEMKPMLEEKDKLYENYLDTRAEFSMVLDSFKNDINKEFRKHKLYSEKAKENLINSILFENDSKYKERFQSYLKSRKCDVDFYRTFKSYIDKVWRKYWVTNKKKKLYQEIAEKINDREVLKRSKRYKMIFPSRDFEPFALGDNNKDLTIKISEDYYLFNTCHINIYISNNSLSRSEIRKDPDIIRLDYCYVDNNGNKSDRQYFIENETTRNCKFKINYFEQDFYNIFVFRPERFKITSLIDNDQDNSFISILSEFKHGMNDYTIRDKELVRFSFVVNEIQQLIDEGTRFKVDVSESYPCLEKSLMKEGLYNNPFVDKLLTRKLPKIRRKRESKSKFKKVEQNDQTFKTRAEKYEEKLRKRSNNQVTIFNYISSKEKVRAKCNSCEFEWEIRSDHLLARPYCPLCRTYKDKSISRQ